MFEYYNVLYNFDAEVKGMMPHEAALWPAAGSIS